jgi:hypothetical protein
MHPFYKMTRVLTDRSPEFATITLEVLQSKQIGSLVPCSWRGKFRARGRNPGEEKVGEEQEGVEGYILVGFFWVAGVGAQRNGGWSSGGGELDSGDGSASKRQRR